ncbi:MAG: hypothetical protein GZ088_05780 [Acidipila sp.]|nr:hypothetical protein [Acidipila sp.]
MIDRACLLARQALSPGLEVCAEFLKATGPERQEVLQSSISYSRTDLLEVRWTGAFVHGSTEGAAATIPGK